ncbi:MAG: hypothetical protein ACTHMC_01610 [Pseudobacter sp.]|uniref:hypothetical protein n=1 Tax=Pseudobacter sp. TaxID=2045420 RepID=UPI003F816313
MQNQKSTQPGFVQKILHDEQEYNKLVSIIENTEIDASRKPEPVQMDISDRISYMDCTNTLVKPKFPDNRVEQPPSKWQRVADNMSGDGFPMGIIVFIGAFIAGMLCGIFLALSAL